MIGYKVEGKLHFVEDQHNLKIHKSMKKNIHTSTHYINPPSLFCPLPKCQLMTSI